ncbi:MAG: hypothetical protein JST00_41200 [Deltaproteobacteria bacterium]|nr:hypothetical protein [Deltaproteobacteria bacterium]
MFFRKKQNTGVEKAAMALAAAGGAAHAAFFAMFALRVIGRDGFGTIGWAILALLAAAGMGLNMLGYFLIKRGEGPLRRWGFMSVAASTLLAGLLLGIASWTG